MYEISKKDTHINKGKNGGWLEWAWGGLEPLINEFKISVKQDE